MGSVAPQLDLFAPREIIAAAAGARFALGETKFRIDPPVAVAVMPPARAASQGMTAEAREWAERTMLAWSRRAGTIRMAIEAGDRSRGAANRLFALEWHVRRLREALGGSGVVSSPVDAAPPARASSIDLDGPVAAELARLRASLEQWQPRRDPKLGVDVHGGPISAEMRAQLQAKIDALEGGA